VPDIPPQKIPGYEFIGLIGAGGMGVIYKARHELLGKTVAIKLLPPGNVTEQSMLRFYAEAKAVSKLHHPGIVAIHDFGVLPSGVAFMVLDYIDGITLKDFIEKGLPCPLTVFCGIFERCCEALMHAHQQGIFHRDIKPANIMLSGKPYKISILDFGIAQIQAASQRKLDLTKTGEIMGTPLYVCPEHIKGESLDARADIYALGCVMFEVLAHRPPFEKGTAFATISAHLSEPVPRLPKDVRFADNVMPIIEKMLAKDRTKRYATMDDVLKDIKLLARGVNLSARRRLIRAGVVSIAVAVGLSVAVGLWFLTQLDTKSRGQSLSHVSKPADTPEELLHKMRRDYSSDVVNSALSSENRADIVLVKKGLTDSLLARVSSYHWVRVLDIPSNFIDDRGLTSIAGLSLTLLNLDGNPVTDAGMKVIARIKSLVQLELANTDLTDRGIEQLKNLPDLLEIYLDNTKITDESSKILAQMPKLETISLVDNFRLTEATVKNLATLPRLKVLNLRGVSLKDSDLAYLSKYKALYSVCLSGKGITNGGIKYLAQTQISQIELSHCSIDDAGLLSLGKLKHLSSICIYDSLVSEAGVAKFKYTCPSINLISIPNREVRVEPYRL
jgi:serine/threonine protein kinase